MLEKRVIGQNVGNKQFLYVGLKKLEASTDNSYLNIQRLVLKYLHVVAQSINFILFEIEGVVSVMKILMIEEDGSV